jgi:hypothetical protein
MSGAHHTPDLQEVVYEIFDPKAERSAKKWVSDIAKVVAAASEVPDDDLQALGIHPEGWDDVYRPALLWRFFRHLASELNQIADGHAEDLANTLKKLKEEADGLGNHEGSHS